MKRDLDISSLRSFLAVAENNNVTHAAARRHLTQSAVSQQIKKIEEQLGLALFDRHGKSLRLSKKGSAFLPYAQQIVDANDRSVSFAMGTAFEETIALGVPHDIVASMLPEALEQFHLARPDVRVVLVSGASRNLVRKLENGELDMALTTDTRPSDIADQLRRDPLVWLGKSGGRAYLKRPLSVALGSSACPFRAAATEALDAAEIPWRAITQVGSLEPVFATLLSDMAVSPFLRGTGPAGTREVEEGLPKLPSFYIHLRQRNETALTNILADCLCGFLSKTKTG